MTQTDESDDGYARLHADNLPPKPEPDGAARLRERVRMAAEDALCGTTSVAFADQHLERGKRFWAALDAYAAAERQRGRVEAYPKQWKLEAAERHLLDCVRIVRAANAPEESVAMLERYLGLFVEINEKRMDVNLTEELEVS